MVPLMSALSLLWWFWSSDLFLHPEPPLPIGPRDPWEAPCCTRERIPHKSTKKAHYCCEVQVSTKSVQGRRGELQPNWQKHNPNPSWNNKELYSFLSYSLTINDAVWETIRQPVEFLSGRSGSSRWLKQELTNQQSCFHIAAPQLDELHLNIECIPYLYLVLLGQWFSVHSVQKVK